MKYLKIFLVLLIVSAFISCTIPNKVIRIPSTRHLNATAKPGVYLKLSSPIAVISTHNISHLEKKLLKDGFNLIDKGSIILIEDLLSFKRTNRYEINNILNKQIVENIIYIDFYSWDDYDPRGEFYENSYTCLVTTKVVNVKTGKKLLYIEYRQEHPRYKRRLLTEVDRIYESHESIQDRIFSEIKKIVQK